MQIKTTFTSWTEGEDLSFAPPLLTFVSRRGPRAGQDPLSPLLPPDPAAVQTPAQTPVAGMPLR